MPAAAPTRPSTHPSKIVENPDGPVDSPGRGLNNSKEYYKTFISLLARVESRRRESNLFGGTQTKSKTKVRLAAGLTTGAMMFSISGPAFAEPVQINTGSLVSALNNVNIEIDNVLNDLTITDVRVVNVEDSVNNNRVLNNVLNNNQTDITVLQNFLNSSLNDNNVEFLQNFLNNNNIAVSDVVAIDVLSGGGVVIFVQ